VRPLHNEPTSLEAAQWQPCHTSSSLPGYLQLTPNNALPAANTLRTNRLTFSPLRVQLDSPRRLKSSYHPGYTVHHAPTTAPLLADRDTETVRSLHTPPKL
jgi:hypothetical protein